MAIRRLWIAWGVQNLPALQRRFSQAFAEPGQSHWLAHAMQQGDVAFAWRYPTADGGEWRELQCRAHQFQIGGSTLLLMRCTGPDELNRYRQEADRQAERYQMLFQGSLDAVVSLIRDFQLAELKVDKSYVDAIEASRQNRSTVKAMVALAEAESIRLVAEGVETESQFAALKQLGVPRFQGYLFAKPHSAEAFEALQL